MMFRLSTVTVFLMVAEEQDTQLTSALTKTTVHSMASVTEYINLGVTLVELSLGKSQEVEVVKVLPTGMSMHCRVL